LFYAKPASYGEVMTSPAPELERALDQARALDRIDRDESTRDELASADRISKALASAGATRRSTALQ